MMTNEVPAAASRWKRWGWWCAFWTFLGVFQAVHSYFQYGARGSPISGAQALGFGLALWYAWGLLAVAIFAFSCRVPFDPRRWPRCVAQTLAAAAGFALLKLALDYPIIEVFYCPRPGLMPFGDFYRMAFASQFHPYSLIALAMLGISHGWNYYRQDQQRALKTWQLEARLAQAQLQLLKMQLHPHFLFNTLSAISALIHRDIDLADRMIARLGDLLRLTLETAGTHEVTLERELAFVEAYLEIEQVRFGPRLSVQMAIEPEVLKALVPSLVLQPLVENALRHGMPPTPRLPARITLRATQVGDRLRLEVTDNGPGLRSQLATNGRKGIGLANTRARLQQLYGNDQSLVLTPGPDGGVRAIIELPLCIESSGSSSSGEMPLELMVSAHQPV